MAEYMNDDAAQQLAQLAMTSKGNASTENYVNDVALQDNPDYGNDEAYAVLNKRPSQTAPQSPQQKAYYDKLARMAKESRDSNGYSHLNLQNSTAASAPAPKKTFATGFDYAQESEISAFVRGPTVKAGAQKASSTDNHDYAKISTIKELDKNNILRSPSVSVAVKGPSPSKSEMSKQIGPLSRSSWFYDGSDRSLFEKTVAACMRGDFLVRKSGSSPGYVLCVNDSGQPINFTINTMENNTLEFTQQIFKSLEEVVEYARRTPLKSRVNPGERLKLGSPAVRESWFPIGMSRERCEAAIAAGTHGCFVVRLSSSQDKYVLVVNDKGNVCSYTITKINGRVQFGGSIHDTIAELIEHIKVKPFQSKVTQQMTLGYSAFGDR